MFAGGKDFGSSVVSASYDPVQLNREELFGCRGGAHPRSREHAAANDAENADLCRGW